LLAIVVLLLVIMPALLYLVAFGAMRYTRKAPARIGSPTTPKKRGDTPHAEVPVRVET